MQMARAHAQASDPQAVRQRDLLATYGGDSESFKGFLVLPEEMSPEGTFLLRGVIVDGLADSDVGRHLMRMAAQDKPAFAVLKQTARTFVNRIIRNQSAVCSIHTSAPAGSWEQSHCGGMASCNLHAGTVYSCVQCKSSD